MSKTNAAFAELEVEIEAILSTKEEVTVEEVCLDLGILKDRINMMLRRYICHVMRKNGWVHRSVYNKETRKSEKAWIYSRKLTDLDYLRGNKEF